MILHNVSRFIVITTLYLATHLTAHLAASSPLSLTLPLPLTTLPANLTTSTPNCIEDPAWVTSSFLAGDCYTSIDKLHNRETDRWGNMILEFLAKGITPSPEMAVWAQTTPRKYKYKSCTVAIVLMRDLPGGDEPGSSLLRTDLSTYIAIENAAKRVADKCLSVVSGNGEKAGGAGAGAGVQQGNGRGELGFVNPTGYGVVGAHRSIGVFLWDTNSAINQQVLVGGGGSGGGAGSGVMIEEASSLGNGSSSAQSVDVG